MNNTHFKIRFISCLLCIISLFFTPFQTATARMSEYISITKDKNCANNSGEPQYGTDSVQLDCKTYHQTTNYTCGPAAIMTLMHFYGKLSDSEMNTKTELRIALEMNASEKGTTLSEVSSWLTDHGFKVDSGIDVSSKLIIDNLKKGIPTLIAVNHHWILAKGFTNEPSSTQTDILFSDSCCSTTSISTKEIDTMWAESQLPAEHCGTNVGEYVVAIPK